jgi:hypothetical protein
VIASSCRRACSNDGPFSFNLFQFSLFDRGKKIAMLKSILGESHVLGLERFDKGVGMADRQRLERCGLDQSQNEPAISGYSMWQADNLAAGSPAELTESALLKNTTVVLSRAMTEKRKPTYDIEAVKAVFSTVEKLNVTGSALRGAASLGFGRNEIVATIQTIERRHFL